MVDRLAYLTADNLDALKTARDALIKMRAEGLRQIRYTANGIERFASYATDIEAASALKDIEQRIAKLEGNLPRHLRVRAVSGY
jgi:hypothetical protein